MHGSKERTTCWTASGTRSSSPTGVPASACSSAPGWPPASRGEKFHVVGATAAAYLLWFVMLDRMAVSTATMTSFAIPVVGVLSAMALVGDRPSPLDWVGFAAIMTAASIAVFGAKRA